MLYMKRHLKSSAAWRHQKVPEKLKKADTGISCSTAGESRCPAAAHLNHVRGDDRLSGRTAALPCIQYPLIHACEAVMV